jgi:hypothetical protein
MTVEEKLTALRIEMDNVFSEIDELKKNVTSDRGSMTAAIRRIVGSMSEVRKKLGMK